MSANASVLAIVPFQPDNTQFLEYDWEVYRKVKPGTPIVLELFSMRTSDSSRDLAELLGVDLNDAATWPLDPARCREVVKDPIKNATLSELVETAGHSRDDEVFADIVNVPGVQLFFRPNY